MNKRKNANKKEHGMSKYLDPKTDITFKKVFGEHPDLLMSLLNALLPLEDGHEIESLEYLSNELISRTPLTKWSIVDVRCKDNHGRQFIVEMQMEWNSEFTQRVLYNASHTYVKQLEPGLHYDTIQPVYSLNLINDIYEKDDDEFYHHYQMAEENHPEHIIEGIHLLFFELPKFKPQTISEKKMQVLWLRFLTEINMGTKVAPTELLENEEVSKALKLVEESAFSDAEMNEYDHYIDAVRWELTKKHAQKVRFEKALKQGMQQSMQQGLEQGIQQGIQQGLEKGRAEGILSVAINMKKKGIATSVIAETTGLTTEEIEKL